MDFIQIVRVKRFFHLQRQADTVHLHYTVNKVVLWLGGQHIMLRLK